MARLKILTSEEIKAFDKPPKFNAQQREKYFNISENLDNILKRLRNPTYKLGIILQWGYFRASGRFFSIGEVQRNFPKTPKSTAKPRVANSDNTTQVRY